MTKQLVTIQYNGFHGRNDFTLRVVRMQAIHSQYYNADDQKNKIVGYDIDLSPSQVSRINRVVGCSTHKMVFGNLHKIKGACGCGEGVVDFYGREDKVTIRVNTHYVYRGNYPQN